MQQSGSHPLLTVASISVIDTNLMQMVSLYISWFWMQIAHHLTKLFDNVDDLKCQENTEVYINAALGTQRTEKEHVLFHDKHRSNDQIC